MEGKVVFISGGNSGIGLATAVLFAREGADIALIGRRAEENTIAKEEVEKLGARCLTYTGDVSDEAFVKGAINGTATIFGRLDYAFNNAGVEEMPTPFEDHKVDDYDRIMDINLKGVWLCMKYQIPRMLENGEGVIVNTGSAASVVGFPHLPLHVASKHAVAGLTKAVALEYAKKNIRVNAICPGAVKTELYDRFTREDPVIDSRIQELQPMGRNGTPEEVASAVAWLCTEATWTTGQLIMLDGGYTAQ
ncbi:SDR family oxidoreductase [Calycomorphotria hydatis]|uniref:2,5-dichloro-2,5-cyclohexadiene-1,4-diol dehydrogenase n=1 Tax=Calycomorphotria hydatis TaxID=2528027 RepID=A0A517TBU5_9PLAN|nr:SDR family oxidoreductase [Calycomorphotria hydatis]QDT65841.1 2,5-dichloro-2,5-cyclohexadiene-1,4-diol dehydrogenase [Calycomorphotria hydatis]